MRPSVPFPPRVSERLAGAVGAGHRWIVLLMLLALHAALVAEPGGAFERVWLLVHFGLFLLWQPFFATSQRLAPSAAALLVVITAAILVFLAGWMIVTWVLLLLGMLGGRVFTTSRAGAQRRPYLVAFGYLLAMLLTWAVPTLLLPEQEIPMAVATFAQAVLPAALLVIATEPLRAPREEEAQIFDFFYAVMIFQLGVVLVLGSVAVMRFSGAHYFASVALTAFGFGVALFVLAVLWNPLRGFGGLRTYFSRYLLSVGLPFELWMRRIAELAESERDSRRFLEQSVAEIAAFPWIRGGRWRSPDGEGTFGRPEGHATRFAHHALELEFNTEMRLSPALFLHLRLLGQVVGEFYEGKRRESALRRHAYLQAVHETGARLTHDVKNLLQSLYALTAMAPRGSDDEYAALLQRQLPQLAKRLHATLEKLRAPESAAAELQVDARGWWDELARRLAGTDVALEARIEEAITIPGGLFDSFVENALENARLKAARSPRLSVAIRLGATKEGIVLSVEDDGEPVAKDVAGRLFREPIERGEGLGIGLYHVARQARAAGFELTLAANRPGEVRLQVASSSAERAS